MTKRVFISHAREDKAAADDVCGALEASGVQCWIAPRDVQPGVPYGRAIVEAIEECALFLLVFSAHADRSTFVLREVEYAASAGGPLLPVRFDGAVPSKEMRFFVGREQWLDALEGGAPRLDRIADSVKRMLSLSGSEARPLQTGRPGAVSPTELATLKVDAELAREELDGHGATFPPARRQAIDRTWRIAETLRADRALAEAADAYREVLRGAALLMGRDPSASGPPACDACTTTGLGDGETVGSPVQITDSIVLTGHRGRVYSAAFSPDGARVVTSSRDAKARVWDARTGTVLSTLRGHEEAVTVAAFSHGGARIATASEDATARLWNPEDGEPGAVMRGHLYPLTGAAFSADDRRLLTASRDRTARVWSVESGEEMVVLRGHDSDVVSAVFTPRADRVLTASWDYTARSWDAASGRPLVVFNGHSSLVLAAIFDRDLARVITVSADQTARVWESSTGAQLAVFSTGADLYTIALSPDGARVVTASSDQTARVWDASSGSERAVLRGHQGHVRSAAFSPDGRSVLTGSDDGTARLWDSATGRERAVFVGHDRNVNAATFDARGERVVTASMDRSARIWNAGLRP